MASRGPLLGFTLKVIELGGDDDGDPITSILVQQSDAPTKIAIKAQQFVGTNQLAVKKAIEELAPFGDSASRGRAEIRTA